MFGEILQRLVIVVVTGVIIAGIFGCNGQTTEETTTFTTMAATTTAATTTPTTTTPPTTVATTTPPTTIPTTPPTTIATTTPPTTVPTTPPPTTTETSILFFDDFSDENSGWHVYSDSSGWVRYQDGWLHLRNNTSADEETDSELLIAQSFTDFILEVETKLVAGTDDNWHTVSCRLDDETSYYEFSISADGYYRLAVWINDTDIDPSNRPTYTSYINQGWDVVNVIRAECIGSNLRLFVNGHLLTEMTDSRISGDGIYLGVTSLAGSYSEIAFDNLIITEP